MPSFYALDYPFVAAFPDEDAWLNPKYQDVEIGDLDFPEAKFPEAIGFYNAGS